MIKRLCTFAACMLSACGTDLPDDQSHQQPKTEIGTDETPLADGELRIGGEIIADIELDETQSRFVFVELGNGVGLYEQIPPGAPGLAEFPQLEGAPLIDKFLALAKPGTQVPAAIVAYSEPTAFIGPKGWVRDAVARGQYLIPRGNCTNSTFSNAVTSKGYNDDGTPKLRLDKRVGYTSLFEQYTYCGGTNWPGGCPKFHRYAPGGHNHGSQFSNVDKYYTRVALCGLGSHPTITSNLGFVWTHPGPKLKVRHRDSNNNGWFTSINEDFDANDVGGVRAWHYEGGSGFWNFDWRTQIEFAEVNDRFDIGHAVEHLGF